MYEKKNCLVFSIKSKKKIYLFIHQLLPFASKDCVEFGVFKFVFWANELEFKTFERFDRLACILGNEFNELRFNP